MLSCTTLPTPAAPEVPCCRLAPCHRDRAPVVLAVIPRTPPMRSRRVLDPLLPDPAWLAGRGGRPEAHCRRQIVDAIFYLVDNGITWRALPADYPPWSTVYNYLAAWEAAGVTQQVLDGLRDRVRLREGRTAEPSAGIIDSQSVRAAETVTAASRGYDAGKKVNGRKRHIAVDTLGLLLCVLVTACTVPELASRSVSCGFVIGSGFSVVFVDHTAQDAVTADRGVE